MKIAILLATYNSGRYLSQMLSSLVNQTVHDFICYIHDDGSSDNTLEVVSDYVKAHGDRFVLMEDGAAHLGAKGNFFHLLKNVEADVYFFADADDVWIKDKMERSIKALEALSGENKEPVAVYTDMYVTDEKLNVTAGSFIRALGRDPYYHKYTEIIMDNPAAGCSLCFNRACRDAAVMANDGGDGFFKVTELVEMHDVWVLMTAALLGRVGVVDEPLVYYRQHGDNEMGAKRDSMAVKLFKNISGFLNGSIKGDKAAYYKNAKDLAGAALLLEGVPEEKRAVLKGFAELEKMSKLQRIAFLKRNGFRRKKHSLWIWLWA